MLRRAFWLLLFPGGVVSVAVWAAYRWLPENPTAAAAWQLYPYMVLLLGCFYAFRFGRIRLLYLLALLVMLERVTMYAAAGSSGRMVYLCAAVLIPFNFAVIAWMREKGLFSKVGIVRLIFFTLQLLAVLWLEKTQLIRVLSLLERDWIPLAFASGALPQTVTLSLGGAAGLILLRAITQVGILETSLCWSYAVMSAALIWPEYSLVCLSTSGLIAALAVVEVTHFMAFRDELTGLPARRALSEYLARLSGRYTLVMADVDHFKKVNDTHGHDVGDQVLRMVASRLARVAGGGRAFRYGGEEFTLVFAGKSVEAAMPHVEKIRAALANEPFVMRRPGRKRNKPKKGSKNQATALQFTVTASFGLAQRDDAGVTALAVIKQADEALYRAKKNGRNRVCS